MTLRMLLRKMIVWTLHDCWPVNPCAFLDIQEEKRSIAPVQWNATESFLRIAHYSSRQPF